MKLWFCWHIWNKWELVERFAIAREGKCHGHALLQERRCSMCGFRQIALQSEWLQ